MKGQHRDEAIQDDQMVDDVSVRYIVRAYNTRADYLEERNSHRSCNNNKDKTNEDIKHFLKMKATEYKSFEVKNPM